MSNYYTDRAIKAYAQAKQVASGVIDLNKQEGFGWTRNASGIDITGRGNAEVIENAAKTEGVGKVILPPGVSYLERTTQPNALCYIEGKGSGFQFTTEPDSYPYYKISGVKTVLRHVQGSATYLEKDGTLSDSGFLIASNIAYNRSGFENFNNGWIIQFPNLASPKFSEFTIDSFYGDNVARKGIYAAGSVHLDTIAADGISTLYENINAYEDVVILNNVAGRRRPNNTDYFAIINNLGDCHGISGFKGGYTGSQTGLARGLKLINSHSSDVLRLINGIHEFVNCHGLNLASVYGEIMALIIDGGVDNTITSGFISHEEELASEGFYPITVRNTSTNGVGVLNIERIANSRKPNIRDGIPLERRPDVFVDTANNGQKMLIRLNSNVNAETVNAKFNYYQTDMPTVGDSTGIYQKFIDYGHLLKEASVCQGDVKVNAIVPDLEGNFSGLGTATDETNSTATFLGATGTYYMRVNLIVDGVRRIGKTSSEISFTATNGGARKIIPINYGTITQRDNIALEIGVGTSSSSYTQRIIVPVVNRDKISYDGVNICGIHTETVTGAALGTLNSSDLCRGGYINNDRIVIYTDGGVPTQGTWKAGDRVIVREPTLSTGTYTTEYIRLTDGSGHVLDTDWLDVVIST